MFSIFPCIIQIFWDLASLSAYAQDMMATLDIKQHEVLGKGGYGFVCKGELISAVRTSISAVYIIYIRTPRCLIQYVGIYNVPVCWRPLVKFNTFIIFSKYIRLVRWYQGHYFVCVPHTTGKEEESSCEVLSLQS